MKKLEQSWIKKGYRWDVLLRVGRIACIKQSLPGSKFSTYNVVIVQERAEHTWPNGVTSEAHEAIPSAEQWGTFAWTHQDIPSAKERMIKLLLKAAEDTAEGAAIVKFDIQDIEVPVTPIASEPEEDTDEDEPSMPVLKITKTSVEIVIPDGEFTTVQFSELNGLPPVGKGYMTLKQLVEAGKVKEVARRKVSDGRGRATVFYGKA